jgi:phosphatidylserine/phosphatidylglycerophosphate/cardiolipin synthase-like enzyme
MTSKHFSTVCFVLGFLFLGIIPASGTERLCDVSFEDCRAPLLNLIRNENVEIDVAFWFMDDSTISNALIKKFQSGVPVRILMDPRADEAHNPNTQILAALASAGFPMRNRTANGILHWKMMLFSGQGTVEFSGANFTASEMVPYTPFVNYTDEAIYYTDDSTVVNSFRTKYDNWWTDTADYQNYANIHAPLQRLYPIYPINPELDFLPSSVSGMDYGSRSMAAMAAEKVKLDVDMFRITNAQIADATIAAFNRGIPIRMIVDSSEYRNPARVWDSYNVDRMFMAGIPLKITEHQGQNHEKALILYGQGMSIWGSSNWTWPSFNYQQEHNYFTRKPLFFQWFQNQFERRWNSDTEYKAFVPLGLGSPTIKSPISGATGQPTSVTLVWEGGPWAQQYDVYFGTTSNPPLLAQNVVTGAPEDPSGPLTYETYKVSGLAPATRYYWKITSKTMANLSATGPSWTFTTGTPATGQGATVTAISPTTGPSSGATQVTITGTNFLAGAIVSFGQSTAGSIKVTGGTTITAVAPPHVAGTVGITVTNKAGDSGTLPAAYLYTSSSPSTAPKLNVIQPNTGSPSGGDAVSIAGSNLVHGMTVTIGGAPAIITSSNSVSIHATTPSGTGIADLVVTNPNGQSATLRGAFTYAGPPGPPSVTSTAPGSGSVNGGNTITVTGDGFNKGAVVRVGGTLCTTIIVLNSSTITATTPAHPLGSADVVVTNIDGQSGTLPGGFNYVAAPPPNVSSVVPNSGSVAGGSGITINGSNFIFGAKVLVGSTAATVQTTTGSYIYATAPAASQPGTVNVVVTNPDGQSSSPGTYIYQ